MTEAAGRVYRRGDAAPGAWQEFVRAMRSGVPAEVDREMWDYWRDVLPPARMGYAATLPGGRTVAAAFGFAEGAERVVAFWAEGGRLFCCLTDEVNRG